MTRTSKLFAKILADPRASIAFRDFERLLVSFGFALVRQRGSHRVYEHPICPRPMIIQPKQGGEAKTYQLVQFLDMIEEYRLELGER